MTDRSERAVLNHLIETCKDAERGFRHVAEHAADPALKSLFLDIASQRARFAADLLPHAQRLGGANAHDGTAVGTLHRTWIDLRSAISRGDPVAASTRPSEVSTSRAASTRTRSTACFRPPRGSSWRRSTPSCARRRAAARARGFITETDREGASCNRHFVPRDAPPASVHRGRVTIRLSRSTPSSGSRTPDAQPSCCTRCSRSRSAWPGGPHRAHGPDDQRFAEMIGYFPAPPTIDSGPTNTPTTCTA